MKKSSLFVVSLASALFLVACGGKTPTPAPGESKTDTDKPTTSQNHKHSYGEWTETKAPTCTEKGQKERTCECGEKQTQDVAAKGHTFVDDGTVEATCGKEGELKQKCSVCGETKTEAIPSKAHTFVEDGEKQGVVQKMKCSECGGVAYNLLIAEATGWNKSTTKWNAKSGADATATWNLNGIVPHAHYKIMVEAGLSYDSHQDRYWYNQYETDTASSPDTEDQSPWRYFFSQNESETPINPTNMKTWGEDGLSTTPAWVEVVDDVELDATIFSAHHGNIGYSMIWSQVRLIQLTDGTAVTPYTPTTPTDPVDPVDPTTPTDPVDPVDPVDPTTPTDPVETGYTTEIKVDMPEAVGTFVGETDGKQIKNGSVTVKATVTEAGEYDLLLPAKIGAGAESQKLSARDITIKVNDGDAFSPTNNDMTSSELGYNSTEFKEAVISKVTLAAGENSITLATGGSAGYRLLMDTSNPYIKVAK